MEKIKFCILDVYPKDNFRICKDTAGGYGTGNNFGNSILSKILNVFMHSNSSADYGVGYLMSILRNNKTEIDYTHYVHSDKITDAHFIILNSSIVAHETELKALEYLNKIKKNLCYRYIFIN